MPCRLEVGIKDDVPDVVGERLKARIERELGIKIDRCHFVECYNIDADLNDDEIEFLGKEVFTDSVIQEFSFSRPLHEYAWRIEIGFLPGVTDNVGKTASEAIKDALGKVIPVYYSRLYAIVGNVDEEICELIGSLLHNELIEQCIIHEPLKQTSPYLPKVKIEEEQKVERISLRMSKARLEQFVKERLLALSLEELNTIRAYLSSEQVLKERKKVGLDSRVTDVEIEAIAQTWSEHCKHKIFNALITYYENGERHAINSLFKTFIVGATEKVQKPYVVSVFKDNGGIIKFNQDYDIAVKVETHNAPSALDPYGGALTGILGVQRDVLATGLGALPIANVNMLCFGPLNAKETEVPKGVIHPKRMFEGVVKGIEHGGNKMGIPTVNGSITFHQGFTTRPLVFCGTIGIMPSLINGRKTSEKRIEPGWLAVMVGGRIGKDGIHGATFSSQQLHGGVPQSVVQIGDPITQKKMLDFIIEARDKLLYEAITDNGAGGLSSSIGELARYSDGCEIWLDACPLKYQGLQPWEILVSESQERMTLVVRPEKLHELERLAKKHDVEITVVGKFTATGKFHVLYKGKTVAYLSMKFLHEGMPRYKLKARWEKRSFIEPDIYETDLAAILLKLLSMPNIASKEWVIRQYDHEVKAMSVVKPLMIGPSDGAVIAPLYNSKEGIVIAHGICPKFVHDSYDMAALAFDEGVRNAIACGAKFGYMAALDNFSWPDPIQSDKTPDGEYKLAQLVRACISLYNSSVAYGIPFISGKDSMKNDYYADGQKYSIPPTLLITIIGKIDDISKAMNIDFKNPGDIVYVLGTTREELGGSEYYALFNAVGNNNPKVRLQENAKCYRALSQAIEDGLVASVHDVSDGGIGVALAECTFGKEIGVELDLSKLIRTTEKEDALLFSESAGRFIVSVNERHVQEFEKLMEDTQCARVGRVRGDKRFIIKRDGEIIINENVELLKEAWSNGLKID
jgi:phosphoribosylformylglycinamidine synthase